MMLCPDVSPGGISMAAMSFIETGVKKPTKNVAIADNLDFGSPKLAGGMLIISIDYKDMDKYDHVLDRLYQKLELSCKMDKEKIEEFVDAYAGGLRGKIVRW